MTRQEFIESCKDLTEEQMLAIVKEARVRAGSRVTPEAAKAFRSLDDITAADELRVPTAWGRTHVFMVRRTDAAGKVPVLVNVHGGGWSLDHTERDVYFSRRIAARTGCLVVDVDYVLAPEYPYPAALEELEALLNTLPELCAPYGGDMDRVILCGQSAGGNLLAGVSQRRKVQPRYKTLAQILCYMPADNLNDHFGGGELDERGKSTEYYGFFYNRVFAERGNHDVSMALSAPEELVGLPATDMLIAGIDNLVEEQKKYFDLLQQAGVPSTCRLFGKSRHGFIINLYDEWKEGEDYIVSLIGKHLAEAV